MQLNWELVLALLLVDSTLVACRHFRKNLGFQNFPNHPPQRDESCSDGEDDFRAPGLGTTLSEYNGSVFSEIESVLPKDCGRVPSLGVTGYTAGGTAAKPGEYPSFMDLEFDESQFSHLCGGVLISNRHILTTAFCLEGVMDTLVYPTIYYDISKEIGLKATKFCNSRKFKGNTFIYDIGLVTLDKPIEFTDRIQPACLPRSPIEGPEMDLKAVGMGGIEDNSNADVLQVLPVHKVECDKVYLHDSRLCYLSNTPNGGTSLGDMGGPIFGIKDGRMTVYGANSFGRPGTDGKSIAADFYSLSREIVELFKRCGDVDV